MGRRREMVGGGGRKGRATLQFGGNAQQFPLISSLFGALACRPPLSHPCMLFDFSLLQRRLGMVIIISAIN